jgi:hypothetical protein
LKEREKKLSDLAAFLVKLAESIQLTVKQVEKRASLVVECAEKMNELTAFVDSAVATDVDSVVATEKEQNPVTVCATPSEEKPLHTID